MRSGKNLNTTEKPNNKQIQTKLTCVEYTLFTGSAKICVMFQCYCI